MQDCSTNLQCLKVKVYLSESANPYFLCSEPHSRTFSTTTCLGSCNQMAGQKVSFFLRMSTSCHQELNQIQILQVCFILFIAGVQTTRFLFDCMALMQCLTCCMHEKRIVSARSISEVHGDYSM